MNYLVKNLRYRIAGAFNAICDRCGMRFAGEQLRTEWTGYRVCQWCMTDRHTIDNASDYSRIEDGSVDNARQEPSISLSSCDISGGQAVAGFAVAGCAVAGQRNRWGI